MERKLNNLILVKNIPSTRAEKRQAEREYKNTLSVILPLFKKYDDISLKTDKDRSEFNDLFIKKANEITAKNSFVAVNNRAFLLNVGDTEEEELEKFFNPDMKKIIPFCIILFFIIFLLSFFF